MEPPVGHIGPTAASADACLFVRAIYFAELLYARKDVSVRWWLLFQDTEVLESKRVLFFL